MASIDELFAETLASTERKPRRETPSSDLLKLAYYRERWDSDDVDAWQATHRVVMIGTGLKEPVHVGLPQFEEPPTAEARTLAATLAKHLDRDELQELNQALEGTLAISQAIAELPPHPALEGLEQEPLTDAERIEATVGGLLLRFGLRRRLFEGSVSATNVAERLGVDPVDVDWRRERGLLVAIESTDGRWVYPACQFDDTSQDGMVAGLQQVLALLTDLAPLQTAAWLMEPKPALGGRAPIDDLRKGSSERVELLARRIAGIRG